MYPITYFHIIVLLCALTVHADLVIPSDSCILTCSLEETCSNANCTILLKSFTEQTIQLYELSKKEAPPTAGIDFDILASQSFYYGAVSYSSGIVDELIVEGTASLTWNRASKTVNGKLTLKTSEERLDFYSYSALESTEVINELGSKIFTGDLIRDDNTNEGDRTGSYENDVISLESSSVKEAKCESSSTAVFFFGLVILLIGSVLLVGRSIYYLRKRNWTTAGSKHDILLEEDEKNQAKCETA